MDSVLSPAHLEGMRRLVGVVQELSLARTLPQVQRIVREAARELTGADGATFVLREADLCYYADENAIAPLWKGSRFPMNACISGWVMLHGEPAVIEDIYGDDRIPVEAYRPTFVKSLAMVPIRRSAPIGAIGNYWARRRQPTEAQLQLLQALADSTSCAMESVQLYGELERRVAERTAQLEAANEALEAFSFSVSHDLRAPLRRVTQYTELLESHLQGGADTTTAQYMGRIRVGVERMDRLIDDLLLFSRLGREQMRWESVDVSSLVHQVRSDLGSEVQGRRIVWRIHDLPQIWGDRALLRVVFANLIGNAVKYTRPRHPAEIEIEARQGEGQVVVSVRDNGVGFDGAKAGELFGVFHRLHSQTEFPGTGIGLANVRRAIERHGGRTWAEGEVGKGATFSFCIPA